MSKEMQSSAKNTTSKPLPVGVESKSFPLFFNSKFHKELGKEEEPPNKKDVQQVGGFIKTIWNKQSEEYAKIPMPSGFREANVKELPSSLLPLHGRHETHPDPC